MRCPRCAVGAPCGLLLVSLGTIPREPTSLSYFNCIWPGDMGYICDNCFNLLFYASCISPHLKNLDLRWIFYPLPYMSGYLPSNQETTMVCFTPLILQLLLSSPLTSHKFNFVTSQGTACQKHRFFILFNLVLFHSFGLRIMT